MHLFTILLILTIFCLTAEAEPLDLKSYSITIDGHTYKDQSGNLPNFHQVHPFLYRGGEPTAEGLKQLAKMGVKTIIDLRNPGEKKIPEQDLALKLSLNYISIPMGPQAPTETQVKTFVTAVEAAKNNPKQGSVFLHCAHGSDRTGCLIGIWRVTHDNYSYEEAYKEMRQYYFGPKYTLLAGAVEQASKKATSR